MGITAVIAGGAAAKGVADYQGAKKAGQARMSAADQALNTQNQYYDQSTELLNPYVGMGTDALNRINSLYGMNGDGAAPDYSAFEQSPDYQFALEQGNRSVNQGLAARRMSNSGAAMKELQTFGSGLASQNLGNYKQQLMGMLDRGQNATGQQVNLNQATASNISNIQTGKGEAKAGEWQQRMGAIGGAIGTGTNALSTGMGGGYNTQAPTVTPTIYQSGRPQSAGPEPTPFWKQ